MPVLTASDEGVFPDLSDGLTGIQRGLLEVLLRKTRVAGKQKMIRSDLVLKALHGGPVPPMEAALTALPDRSAAAEPYLSTYLQLTELAHPSRTRYPLVSFQGLADVPPAEPVLTRCGLTELGASAAAGLVPTLLVNGHGDGASAEVYFPPHLLGDVLDAVSALVQEPSLSDERLVSFVPGPDLPLGGTLPSGRAARHAYLTGQGNLVVRARLDLTAAGARLVAVLEEMPGWVTPSRLLTELSDAVRTGALQLLSEVRDRTSERGVPRIELVFKAGAAPEASLAELFARTSLETKLRIDMRARVGGVVRRVSLPEVLRAYVQQLRAGVARRGERDVGPERLLRELAALREAHADARRSRIEVAHDRGDDRGPRGDDRGPRGDDRGPRGDKGRTMR